MKSLLIIPKYNAEHGLFLILLITSFFASSCGVLSPTDYKNNYSQDEQALIMQKDTTEPMRICLITDRQDSILLRTPAKKVKIQENDPLLDHLIRRMYYTLTDSSALGVGIAAPQVGVLKRVIWVQRFDKSGFPFECYINPEVKVYSEKKQPWPEGCLSIPDQQGLTENRSHTITIGYQNRAGTYIEEQVSSFTAVIFQHEIDHLNGILFLDHLKKERNSK